MATTQPGTGKDAHNMNIVATQQVVEDDVHMNVLAIAVPSAVGALVFLAVAIAVVGVVVLCIKQQRTPQSHGFIPLSQVNNSPVAI